MDFVPIHAIKQRLVDQPDDYIEVAMEFLDLFGTDPRFIGRGVKTIDPELAQMVGEICFEETGSRMQPRAFAGLPEANLLHGGFYVEDIAASVFFFTDVGLGVMTVSRPLGEDPQTRMIRFEAWRAERSGQPCRN